jgi:PTS system nitrogen regulatory IIA component
MINRGPALSVLLRRGGVYRDLPGAFPAEVLAALVRAVPVNFGPGGADTAEGGENGRERLLKAVLEREELQPTAMGNGVALPHPRNPVIENEAEGCAALGFTKNKIDWGALDGKPVTTLILVVSASAKMHLALLQRISFFCRDSGFTSLLDRRAPAEEIFGYIEKTEAGWI